MQRGCTSQQLDDIAVKLRDAIVIDTAHGHSKYVIEKLREAKASFPNVDIVVGNVATGEAASMLVENGADAVIGHRAGYFHASCVGCFTNQHFSRRKLPFPRDLI